MNANTSWLLHAAVVAILVFVVVWLLERFSFFKEGSTVVRAVLILVAVFGVTSVVNLFWPT